MLPNARVVRRYRTPLWIVLGLLAAIALGAIANGFGITSFVRTLHGRGRQGEPGIPGSNAPLPSYIPLPSNGPVGQPGSNAPLPSNGPVGSPGPVGQPGSNAPIPSASPSPSPLPPGCDFFKSSVCADEINTDTVNTISTCSQVYDHTEDGVILPDWSIQTLQGAGEPVEVPVPSFPVDAFPLNAFPTGSLAPTATLATSNGLVVEAISPYISLITIAGENVLQIGEPEPAWSASTNNDQAPPGNSALASLQFTVDKDALPFGAQALAFDVVMEYSTEEGYDFFSVSGAVTFSASGYGPPSAPYLNASASGVVIPGTSVVAQYAKDPAILQGFDNCRLYIRNVRPVAIPPPAPLGLPGLAMTLPATLEDYVCREVTVCANDEYVHVINMTGTGLSFDLAGDYTEMLFVGGGPCCVKLTASSATRMSVQTPQSSCAQFCRPNGQGCTTTVGKLSETMTSLELDATGTFPPTHEHLVLSAGGPTLHAIPCDLIDEYVGRRYLVTNAAGSPRRISIVSGANPCGAHFQVGDPLAGRQRADTLLLDAERGAFVEFVVVSSDLIVVTSNAHVRRCSLLEGFCAPVGEMLSIFSGWWMEDGAGFPLSPLSDPTGFLIHFADRSVDSGNDVMSVEMFQGPPKYMHTPNVGMSSFSLNDYPKPQTIGATLVTPFEFCFGTPGPFVQCGQINPNDPSQLFIQPWPWGVNPFVAIIAREWDPRLASVSPYFIYRRVGAPFGAAPSSPSLAFNGPQFLPFTSPDLFFSTRGFRDTHLLFDYYVQAQMYTYNHGTFGEGAGKKCDGIESREVANAFAQRILRGEEFVTVNDIVRVQRTATSQLVTLIETHHHHNATIFSMVEISGVTGPWSVLNGVHRATAGTMNPSGKSVPGTEDDDSDDPAQRSLHFYVEIDFDSSGLPADPVTGFELINGTVTVRHGPLTADLEYRPFMDLVYWFDGTIFWEPTHHFMRYPAYSGGALDDRSCRTLPDTWAQIQSDITNDPAGIHTVLGPLGRDPVVLESRIVTRTHNEDVSSRYVGQFISDLTPLFDIESNQILPEYKCAANYAFKELVNDPSGETYTAALLGNTSAETLLANPLNRHIPFENYIEPDTWYIPYWQTGGAPTPDTLGNQFLASVAYPPYDGSTGDYLIGRIYRYDELPCTNCNLLTTGLPLNGPCSSVAACLDETACADGLCESYYEYVRDTDPLGWREFRLANGCGIVNRSFTSSHVIAYCYWVDTQQGDPLNLLTARVLSQPGTGPVSNPRRRREAASGMFAPIFQYLFANQSAEAIIHDIRGNNGGSFIGPQTISEFTGSQRKRTYASQRMQNFAIQQPRQDYDDLFDPYNLTGSPAGALMDLGVRNQYPAINEANYPGSTNPDALVYVLSNREATSGGDLFVREFAGDNLDGNMGAGSIAKIIGNPVGTLWGCNGGNGANLPATPQSYQLVENSTGRPIAPLWMSLDFGCTPIAWQDRVTPTCARVPFSFPAPLSTLPGKSGSAAPPHDIETLWYPDIGWLPNTRPRLAGDTRPQTPTQPSERRDAWLEGTIQQALNELPARRRSTQTELEEYHQEVQMWRDRFVADAKLSGKKQARSLQACGGETVPVTAVPKLTVATVHYARQGALADPGESGTTFKIGDKAASEVEVQAHFYSYYRDLTNAGALCENDDGSLGYTPKALELGLPTLRRDL
jgi:hypothetical protein